MKFLDKYKLTTEQNLFLAKKKWDENIYCGMKMEGRAITFPQTKTILNGVNVPNVQLDDIQAVLNMRDAWRFVFSTANDNVDIVYLCKLNEYIARNEALEWGKLRTGMVSISGTDYVPTVPKAEIVAKELNDILNEDTTDETDARYLNLSDSEFTFNKAKQGSAIYSYNGFANISAYSNIFSYAPKA